MAATSLVPAIMKLLLHKALLINPRAFTKKGLMRGLFIGPGLPAPAYFRVSKLLKVKVLQKKHHCELLQTKHYGGLPIACFR